MKEDRFAGHAVRPTLLQRVNPRADPFEQHIQVPAYREYAVNKLLAVVLMGALVQTHLAAFQEFPPMQGLMTSTSTTWSLMRRGR